MLTFSIVIPCYNAAATLPETLASLTRQTHPGWQAICIDDGSTDATAAIVADWAARDPRITLVRNPGKGPSDARNHGAMDLARGEIIAFCDADDLWSDTKLFELATVFSDAAVDAAYGQIGFFRDSPADCVTVSTVPAGSLTIRMLLGENPVCTMSNIAVRAQVFARTGGFDRSMVHNEDLEWLIRTVGEGTRIVGLPSLQTWYRTSGGGLSADLAAMEQGRAQALRTAARFGHAADPDAEAIHQRYLARRSLRLGQGRLAPLRFALRGLAHHPAGFFDTPRRGLLTLFAAGAAVVLPARVTHSLFSR